MLYKIPMDHATVILNPQYGESLWSVYTPQPVMLAVMVAFVTFILLLVAYRTVKLVSEPENTTRPSEKSRKVYTVGLIIAWVSVSILAGLLGYLAANNVDKYATSGSQLSEYGADPQRFYRPASFVGQMFRETTNRKESSDGSTSYLKVPTYQLTYRTTSEQAAATLEKTFKIKLVDKPPVPIPDSYNARVIKPGNVLDDCVLSTTTVTEDHQLYILLMEDRRKLGDSDQLISNYPVPVRQIVEISCRDGLTTVKNPSDIS